MRHNGPMAQGQHIVKDMERARRLGDPRLTESDRDILRRVTSGDLADQFAAALAADAGDDDLLGPSPAVD